MDGRDLTCWNKPVWAYTASTGWRAATAHSPGAGGRTVRVYYEDGGRGHVRPEGVRPRDPALGGSDKPE